MDYSRLSSPPSIRIHDHNGSHHARKRSTSRPTGSLPSGTPGPMAIPNSRPELPPPPLPPPKFIDDITAGSDPGWAWGNDPSGTFGKRKEPSSMAGSKFPKSWSNRGEEKREVERDEEYEYRRRQSSTATIRSPASSERRHDFARQQDEGYYSMSGTRPSAMSQQLVYIFC